MSQVVESEGMFGQLIGIMIIIVGIIIAILVISSLDSTIDDTSLGVNFTPNSDLVVNSGYVDLTSLASAFGTGTTQTERHFLSVDNISKIRQNGISTQLNIPLGPEYDSTSLTSFYVSVWRAENATSWDRIDTTGDILAKIQATAGGVQTITLDSSEELTHQEGDYIGFGWTNTVDATNPQPIEAELDGGATSSYFYNGTPVPGTSGIDWTTGTSTSTSFTPIQLMNTAPGIVFIGDSITEGSPNHKSYINESEASDDRTISVPYKAGTSLGTSWQNMAHGGGVNQASHGLARFTEDVVDLHPKAVVIGYGTSDVTSGIPQSTYRANMEAMVSEAQTNNIEVIIHAIYPRTDFTNAEAVTADEFNVVLQDIALQTGATFIDTRPVLGVERVGGSPTPPVGNVWDLNAAYDNGDGIHMNEAGNDEITTVVVAGINSVTNSISDARHDLLDNASVIFSLAAVLVLLLIIPMIRFLAVRN